MRRFRRRNNRVLSRHFFATQSIAGPAVAQDTFVATRLFSHHAQLFQASEGPSSHLVKKMLIHSITFQTLWTMTAVSVAGNGLYIPMQECLMVDTESGAGIDPNLTSSWMFTNEASALVDARLFPKRVVYRRGDYVWTNASPPGPAELSLHPAWNRAGSAHVSVRRRIKLAQNEAVYWWAEGHNLSATAYTIVGDIFGVVSFSWVT